MTLSQPLVSALLLTPAMSDSFHCETVPVVPGCTRIPWVSVALLAVSVAVATPAHADELTVEPLYAEPDIRIEAAALTILLHASLRRIRLHGHISGHLHRTGMELHGELWLRDANGKVLGHALVTAPVFRFLQLARELTASMAESIGRSLVPPPSTSLGHLYPVLQVTDALERGQVERAVSWMDAIRPGLNRAILESASLDESLGQDEELPFETRFTAALLSGNPTLAGKLATDWQARTGKDDPVARAARSQVHVANIDYVAARQELSGMRPARQPFVRLAQARLAVVLRNDLDRLGELLTRLVSKGNVRALAMIADLPLEVTLPDSLHRAALSAVKRVRGEYPGLASSLALRAALAGVDIPAALDLVALRWLSEREVASLKALFESRPNLEDLRLRAELDSWDGNYSRALALVQHALRRTPNDHRLRRLRARILVTNERLDDAIAAWLEVQTDESDSRELARAMRQAGQQDKANELLANLEPGVSIEVHEALAATLRREGKFVESLKLLEAAAGITSNNVEVQRSLSQVYAEVGRDDEARSAQQNVEALTSKRHEAPLAQQRPATTRSSPGTSPSTRRPRRALALVSALKGFIKIASGRIRSVVLVPLATDPPIHRLRVGDQEALRELLRESLLALHVRPDGDTSNPPMAEPVDIDGMAGLAAHRDVDAVVLYAVRADEGQPHVRLLFFDPISETTTPFETVLGDDEQDLLQLNSSVYLLLAAVLVLAALWFAIQRLRPRGAIRVVLKSYAAMSNLPCILQVSRSAKTPTIRKPRIAAGKLQRRGHTRSRYQVTMPDPTTEFRGIPTGRWYVHVTGIHRQEAHWSESRSHHISDALSQGVEVVSDEIVEVEVDLEPGYAKARVAVFDSNGPLSGARVWIDDDHRQPCMTATGGVATIDVPLGRHIIHVECRGVAASRRLDVRDAQPHLLSFNLEREQRLAEGLSVPSITTRNIAEYQLESEPDRPGRGGHASDSPGPRRRAADAVESGGAGPTPGNEIVPLGDSAGASYFRTPHHTPGQCVITATLSGATAPTVLGDRYRIIEELGCGGMGVVYRAHDTTLERDVAVKVMHGAIRGHAKAAQLFAQEARSLALLNHQNIITVFDKGDNDDHGYIVMELIEGVTLASYLTTHSLLNIDQAAFVIDRVCAGLSYAHGHKMIHRDIKPENIFLTRERMVKIADFGLARVISDSLNKQTEVRGTPCYMAPEQILGKGIDVRADLYSVGCMMYECVTGRPPFVVGEVLYHHLHTRPEPPSSLRDGIPPSLDRLILSCLEKKRHQRINSADEIRAALAAIVEAA